MKIKAPRVLSPQELQTEIIEMLNGFTRKEPYITNTAMRIYWLVRDNTPHTDDAGTDMGLECPDPTTDGTVTPPEAAKLRAEQKEDHDV